MRLALESTSDWRVVFANDIDEAKAKMYRDAWPRDDHLVVGDIHNLTAGQLPACDLYTASFPCNDLSVAGRREGLAGRESSAFWGLMDIIDKAANRRPPLVLLENVVGFLTSHGGSDFEQALLALNRAGYMVDAFVLNAVHWVPQSRARLFVVGKLDDGRERQRFALESAIRPTPLFEFINTQQHIQWDVRELPRLRRSRKRLEDIVDDLPDEDDHWWSEERVAYFMGQLSKKHEVQAHYMMAGEGNSYATAFRRVRKGRSMAELRVDGIAGCLRTPRGGSGRQILFKAGRGKRKVRLLTARECARLQGVPETYPINVPLNQALFGFGDAVCVPAVRWIARHYLTHEAHILSNSPTLFQEATNAA